MSRTDAALAFIIAVGLGAAFPVCVQRWKAESAYRTVSVVVDGADAARLTTGTPASLESTLRELAQHGATAVAVSEQTLDDLVGQGKVDVAPAGVAAVEEGTAGGAVRGLWLSFPGDDDGWLSREVLASLRTKFPAGRVQALHPPAGGFRVPLRGAPQGAVIFRGSAAELKDAGLALPADVILEARRVGLEVVVRLRNYPRASPAGIRHMLDRAARAGARLIIFEAEQVLGYRSLLRETADLLNSQPEPLVYGFVELGKQMGDESLGRLLHGRLVRVHSIPAAELAKMSPGQAVMRFVRAVKERGVRVCYVRLFQTAQARPGPDDYEYLDSLGKSLRSAGFDLGPARAVPAMSVPLVHRLMMIAGIIAGAVMLLRMVFPLGGRISWVLFAAGGAVGVLLIVLKPDLGVQEKALVAALVFPSIGLVALARWMRRARRQQLSFWRVVLTSAALLIGASLCSLAGGIFVAAMLASREYFAGVDQFRGVKAASLLPVVGLAVVLAGRMNGGESREYFKRVGGNLVAFLRRPVILWEVVAGIVVAAGILIFVMRTGNESAVPPSGLELRVRELLEQALVVRPRTKEFLFGHPAVMLGIAAALRGASGWASVLLLAGAVGQVSVTNTFCHLHTPLAVSLLRTFNGLWLGAAVGALALMVWRVLDRSRRPGGGTA